MRGLVVGLALGLLIATAPTALAQEYLAPRTSFGRPDLQGSWTTQSATQLSRPSGVTSLVVSEAEADKIVKSSFWNAAAARQEAETIDTSKAPEGGAGARLENQGYNSFWLEPGTSLARIKGELRSSWITTPATGQVPMSEEGRKRVSAYQAQIKRPRNYMFNGGVMTDPEQMPNSERCLVLSGPVMLNPVYNANYQIVQTPDHVMIMVEMIHDARIIPLRAKHKPDAIKPWIGDSVGWWEGDTLVVETRNLHPQQASAGPIYLSDKGKVTERFTRISDGEIFYEFQVDDPAYYSQVWGGEIQMRSQKEGIYEYACHEGNYGMWNILSGARIEEAKAAAASR
jgi:hypothetical protein